MGRNRKTCANVAMPPSQARRLAIMAKGDVAGGGEGEGKEGKVWKRKRSRLHAVSGER